MNKKPEKKLWLVADDDNNQDYYIIAEKMFINNLHIVFSNGPNIVKEFKIRSGIFCKQWLGKVISEKVKD